MHGLTVNFTHPWLLLLLIPAAVLTLLPYFLLSKRYRRTRNRIISMVMHGVALTLAIFALSGMTFGYTIHNDENEILLLVDVSDTEEKNCAASRDLFVQDLVDSSAYDGYRIGIVTFGFDQSYTVPFSTDSSAIMNAYYKAVQKEEGGPDKTATNIAGALRYATTLLRYPESAKLVLVTDGMQTDENARSVIRAIAAQGIRVDTVNISEGYDEDHIRVTGIGFPDYHIGLNEEFNLNVELFSTVNDKTATIEIRDNGVLMDEADQIVELIGGSQSVTFRKSFTERGVHEIEVKATVNGDTLEENNTYCSYFNVEVFTDILILQQQDQSEQICSILEETEGIDYNIDVVNISDPSKVPSTLDALCQYDQVILNNISNADLPAGFDELLYNYVYSAGGGVFTTGGMKEGVANAYNRQDLANTLYQQILPVQAIAYTPPVGVEFVIDVSGSMSGGGKLDAAKEGAIACLDVLTERDYVGVVTLSSSYGTVLQPTRRTQEQVIKDAINSVKTQGSTVFSNAIQRAGDALRSLKSSGKVENCHMIIVTDGAPTEAENIYLPVAQRLNRESGITISVVLIGSRDSLSSAYDKMVTLTSEQYGNGRCYLEESNMIAKVMQDDIRAKQIEETEQVDFHPVITDPFSNLAAGLTHETFDEEDNSGQLVTHWRLSTVLKGFYGTRARSSAQTVMTGEYGVPIYSQWRFGRGMVGSFMCDLYGEWSGEFIRDPNGKRFIQNVVAGLMPIESIRSQEIKLNLHEENYINQLGVSVSLGEGDRVEARIVPITSNGTADVSAAVSLIQNPDEILRDDVYVTTYLSAANRYSRCDFVIKTPGIYRIEIMRYNAANEKTAEAYVYKTLSYSKEYTDWVDTDGTTDGTNLLKELAQNGGGKVVDSWDPFAVFDGLIPEIHRTFDPRIMFMVIAIVAFLLDILVRKFKFKWPHELYREYKQRKEEEK